jgi:hypothetical protein
VIQHEVCVFTLVEEEPHAIGRWGGEVAPTLREAAAHERAAATF